MKLALPKLNIAPASFLRQCGYQEIFNPHKQNESSFARGLDRGSFYPRFHIYLEKDSRGFFLNLHLDMKRPSYEGTAAHSGEYSGELVEREAERIKNQAESFVFKNSNQPLGFKKSKSILEKIIDYFL